MKNSINISSSFPTFDTQESNLSILLSNLSSTMKNLSNMFSFMKTSLTNVKHFFLSSNVEQITTKDNVIHEKDETLWELVKAPFFLNDKMTYFSLFSGIGSLELALKKFMPNMECVWACDNDKFAQEIYKKHFPNHPMHGDIREIDGKTLKGVNLVCAWFPCPDFSTCGKGAWLEGSSWQLFYEFLRIVKDSQVPMAIWENVKNLLFHKKGETFKIIKTSFEEIGYQVFHTIINAKNIAWGKQNRERVFLLIIRNDQVERFDDLIMAFQELGNIQSWTMTPLRDVLETNVDPKFYMSEKRKLGVYNSKYNMEKLLKLDSVAPTLTSKGSVKMIIDPQLNKNASKYIEAFTNKKLTPKKLLNIRWFRRLIPLEYERLMGFEDDYTLWVSNTQRYRKLGNSICVNVSMALIELLSKHLTPQSLNGHTSNRSGWLKQLAQSEKVNTKTQPNIKENVVNSELSSFKQPITRLKKLGAKKKNGSTPLQKMTSNKNIKKIVLNPQTLVWRKQRQIPRKIH